MILYSGEDLLWKISMELQEFGCMKLWLMAFPEQKESFFDSEIR